MPYINSEKFSKDLDSVVSNILQRVNVTARNGISSLMDTIIGSHPLDITDPDDIVSKGDWIAAVGREPTGVSRNDASGEQGKNQIRSALSNWKVTEGQSVSILNDKKQTTKLEYGLYSHDPSSNRTTPAGFSTQAPNGFIRINLMRIESIMKDAAMNRG